MYSIFNYWRYTYISQKTDPHSENRENFHTNFTQTIPITESIRKETPNWKKNWENRAIVKTSQTSNARTTHKQTQNKLIPKNTHKRGDKRSSLWEGIKRENQAAGGPRVCHLPPGERRLVGRRQRVC